VLARKLAGEHIKIYDIKTFLFIMQVDLYWSVGQAELYVGLTKEDLKDLKENRGLEAKVNFYYQKKDLPNFVPRENQILEASIENVYPIKVDFEKDKFLLESDYFYLSTGERVIKRLEGLEPVRSHKEIGVSAYRKAVGYRWASSDKIDIFLLSEPTNCN